MQRSRFADIHPDVGGAEAASIETFDPANQAVREEVEGAVHRLMAESTRPAVLLKREWQVPDVSFAFEHMELYREVAAASHCFVVTVDRPEAGGVEHLVFVARIAGLSDEEYIACVGE